MRHLGGRRELRGWQEDGPLCTRTVDEPLRSVEVDEVQLPSEDSEASRAVDVGGRLARRRGE